MTLRIDRIAALATLLCLPALPGLASTSPRQKVLIGLNAVGVVIEPFQAETATTGTLAEQLKAEIVARLQKAGIKVTDDVTAPYLCVTISTLAVDQKSWVLAAELTLREQVKLERAPGRSALATTWRVGGVPSIGQDTVATLRAAVLEQVDAFITDCTVANQKKASPHRK
jgi:hypothetical protein